MQLSDSERGCIVDLREAGWSNWHIGHNLGRSDMAIARNWQQSITEGRVNRCREPEWPRSTNLGKDRAIVRVATSAPKQQLTSIWRYLPPSRHLVVSRETIRMRLVDTGIRSRHPLRSLTLTMHHKHCWLDFSLSRQAGVLPTRHVIFIDESKFNLSAADHCACVGRQSGQWSDSEFVVEWHTAIT